MFSGLECSFEFKLTCGHYLFTLGPVTTMYSEDRVDAAPEMEQWAKRAAQASAARLAHFSISGVTSTLSKVLMKRQPIRLS